MFKKYWSHMLIAIALLMVVTFAVHEAIAKSNLLSQGDASMAVTTLDCASLPSHYSFHTETLKETATSLSYTEDGPTGIDGGFIYLLSSYRTCSR